MTTHRSSTVSSFFPPPHPSLSHLLTRILHPYSSRVSPSLLPVSPLLSLPSDLTSLICSFLLLPEKLLLLSRLSHFHSKLLTPACFRHDHLHLNSDVMSCLQSHGFRLPSLLSSLHSLTLDIHHPKHNYSLLSLPFTLALSSPFPSTSLSFLSITIDKPDLYPTVNIILRALPSLRHLHLDVGGSRIAFPFNFSLLPSLQLIKLRLLLSFSQLSSLLSLPSLTFLDLSSSELEDSSALSLVSSPAVKDGLEKLLDFSLPPIEATEGGMGIREIMTALGEDSLVERLRLDGRIGPLTEEDLFILPHLQRLELHEWKRLPQTETTTLSALSAFPPFTTSSTLHLRHPIVSPMRRPVLEDSLDGEKSSEYSSSVTYTFHIIIVDLQLPPSTWIPECLHAVESLSKLQKIRLRKPVQSASEFPPQPHPLLPDLSFTSFASLHTLILENTRDVDDATCLSLWSAAPSLQDVCMRRCHEITVSSLLSLGRQCRKVRRVQVISCNQFQLTAAAWTSAEAQLRSSPHSPSSLFPALKFLRLDFTQVKLDGEISHDLIGLHSLLYAIRSSPLEGIVLLHPWLTSSHILALAPLTHLCSIRMQAIGLINECDLDIASDMWNRSKSDEEEELMDKKEGRKYRYTELSGLKWKKEMREDRGVIEQDRLVEKVADDEEMRIESMRGNLVFDRVFRRDVVCQQMDGRRAFFHHLSIKLAKVDRSCSVQ